MRRVALLLLSVSAASAGEARWDFEGYPRLFEALARARLVGCRVLVGLSGAPT
jgi:hypothetical protein